MDWIYRRAGKPSGSAWQKLSRMGCVALVLAAAGVGCDSKNPIRPDPVGGPDNPGGGTDNPSVLWDRVLANDTFQGDVVVPAGEKWLIGPNVSIAGNLRTVGGVIAMRPGSSLKFLGGQREQYVGKGLEFGPEFANDIGLWVSGEGVLDIQGTPKVGWNRTGSDPTWKATDEYWISPTAVGDLYPRRWYPGDSIPQVDPRLPPAEVINVTRDIVIEGPGHIHIHSSKPQRIEYVQLRRMGIVKRSVDNSDPALTGRYALHLHLMGDGSRGTVIRGVAAIESEGRVFVPHGSHGVTLIDNVSVNSYAEGFWWDVTDQTHDVSVDHLAVSGVRIPREIDDKSRFDAISLNIGTNVSIKNSAASGAQGGKTSIGFNWGANAEISSVWLFNQGNVAHNNSGAGVRFWTNSKQPHLVENTVLYRNGSGIENGAYRNGVRYKNVLLIENPIVHFSNSGEFSTDGGPGRYEGAQVFMKDGPALVKRGANTESTSRLEFIDCTLSAGPGAPKVFVPAEGKFPVIALFRRCGLMPDDIVFQTPIPLTLEGSSIIIEHEDGRKWEVKVTGNRQVVTSL